MHDSGPEAQRRHGTKIHSATDAAGGQNVRGASAAQKGAASYGVGGRSVMTMTSRSTGGRRGSAGGGM